MEAGPLGVRAVSGLLCLDSARLERALATGLQGFPLLVLMQVVMAAMAALTAPAMAAAAVEAQVPDIAVDMELAG